MKKQKRIDNILGKLKQQNEQNKKIKVFNDVLFLDTKTYENMRFLIGLYGLEKLTQNLPQWKELCRIVNEIADIERKKEVQND